MKKFLNLFSAALVCLVINQTTVLASSHREAPLISNDPLADNTDVYAFRSQCDTNKVVLIANYIPFEHPAGGPNWYTFGEQIRYEVHVDNNPNTPGDDIIYRFTFDQTNQDPTTFFKIRLGQENLKTTYNLERSTNGGQSFSLILANGVVPPPNIGPRSIENTTVGLGKNYDSLMMSAISMATSGEKVFCGPVDDPFFVDLGGAFDLGGFRTPGRDGLAKFNCHSIVIEVPISTLQKDGKTTAQATSILDPDFVIGVWASSSRRQITTFDTTGGHPTYDGPWIQVSRLGMPLTNEAVIPIGQKDKWNGADPLNDAEYGKYFNNPELALYMDTTQYGNAVPGLSKLRIQSKSLGAFDFRNGKKGLFGLKGTPMVDSTALAQSAFGDVLLPDSMSPRAVDLLPIFLTGVPNLRPYQLATGKGGNPLAAGKPFINNFLPTLSDMLRLNMAVPVTRRDDAKFSSLGILAAAVLGLTDSNYNRTKNLQFIPNMDGFPNGRRLEDDVTTIELQAVSGVALAAIGLWYDDYDPNNPNSSPVSPMLLNVVTFNAGVTKNDTTLKECFPYEQGPWRGFVGDSYEGTLIGLPVNFVSFIAEKADKQVNLRWHVANETGNDHYDVEYSLDGSRFTRIGTVKATNGNVDNYQFRHTTPSLIQNNYYRLKQVDADGRFSYSPIRLVTFVGGNTITLSPNPASNFINVITTQSPVTIHVYDATGRNMVTQVISDGSGQINISRLAKGTYIVVAENKGVRIETKKIVKN